MNRIPTRTALAAALAALQFGSVHAQSAAAAPGASPSPADASSANTSPANDGLQLDSVVITGAPTRVSKMKQSNSVSTLDPEQIERSGATNAAELLRSVPGVRAESSGGEGNANITVRGVPISAGGARYVQVQEDGLPVLLFGDIAFGTADEFLRVDYNIDRLEVVRGGSASTLASNSPGGLINFLSKTGEETGGAVGLTAGLYRKEYRVDLDYGGRLAEKTRFHIGGFGRIGEGGRPADFDSAKGGQIKANITQEFDIGYVRLNFKLLDDKTPTFLPVPVTVSDGKIHKISGIDPRTAFFITDSLNADRTLNHDGQYVTSDPHDGLRVRSNAAGLETQLKFAGGWTLDERFRTSDNSGRFIGLFPTDNAAGGTAPFFTGALFNTSLDSLSNTFNDIKISKAFTFDAAKVTPTVGLFNGVQHVDQTWFWNEYNLTTQGKSAEVVNAAGVPTSRPVVSGFETFGGCCARTWQTNYTQTAPYAALAIEAGPVNADLSIRHDRDKASGYTLLGDPDTRNWDPASQREVNYHVSHNSYSGGLNYAVSRDFSVFGRASEGVAFSADRLLYGNPLDGSVPIAINKVKQQEAGVKWRGDGISAFVTAFNARTSESNYEATTQQFTSNTYKSRGVELEAAWFVDNFHLTGGGTYTHARIKESNDASTVGNTPRRQAKFVYQVAPSYTFGPLEVGAQVVGTSKAYGDDGNAITMPAFAIVNAFASYQFDPKTTVLLSANNVFDKLAYTEIEGDGHAARALNGRTVRATVKYQF